MTVGREVSARNAHDNVQSQAETSEREVNDGSGT